MSHHTAKRNTARSTTPKYQNPMPASAPTGRRRHRTDRVEGVPRRKLPVKRPAVALSMYRESHVASVLSAMHPGLALSRSAVQTLLTPYED